MSLYKTAGHPTPTAHCVFLLGTYPLPTPLCSLSLSPPCNLGSVTAGHSSQPRVWCQRQQPSQSRGLKKYLSNE